MEIIHFSAECYPVAKVGGLGDVVGALPKYQNKLGHVAKVVMPAYSNKAPVERPVLRGAKRACTGVTSPREWPRRRWRRC